MNDDQAATMKEGVRADWTARSAAWDRWADQMAALADRFNQPLLDGAGIAPGQKVLDIASGAGEPALTSARRVGPKGRVTATDLVPEMLAGARRRAQAAGLDNIDFEIADMEDLPFADHSFDRLVCRFGIMFSPRPEVALAEARRVLAPGGRAAYLIWGPLEDTTMFKVMWSVMERLLGPPEEDFTYPPFRFGEPGTLAAMMTAQGFAQVDESELRFRPEVPAHLAFWRPQLEMSFAPRVEGLSAARRAELEAAIVEAFAPYRDGEVYRLEAHVRVARGDAPA
jgi:ubiquinone/menaquinone biosynthesis C-methylase UbiE